MSNIQTLRTIKNRVDNIPINSQTRPSTMPTQGQCKVIKSNRIGNGCLCRVHVLSGSGATGIEVEARCFDGYISPGATVAFQRMANGSVTLIAGGSGGVSTSTNVIVNEGTIYEYPTGWLS